MDEAIGWACHLNSIYTVTAKMEVRLKSIARIGEPLIISACITKQTRRTLEVEVKTKRKDDSVVAEASSIQFIAQSLKNRSSESS
jgi:acyl-CoA thioesterase FadM